MKIALFKGLTSANTVLTDLVVPRCWRRPIAYDVIALQTANSLADELVRVWHWSTDYHIASVKTSTLRVLAKIFITLSVHTLLNADVHHMTNKSCFLWASGENGWKCRQVIFEPPPESRRRPSGRPHWDYFTYDIVILTYELCDFELLSSRCDSTAAKHTDIHCEPKKRTHQNICIVFHKTQSILIKFGAYCPE